MGVDYNWMAADQSTSKHLSQYPGMLTKRASVRETVEFSVKGPVMVNFDEEEVTSPGCAIFDLQFAVPSQVGELVFRNYYTAWLTVLVKVDPCCSIVLALGHGNAYSISGIYTEIGIENMDVATGAWLVAIPRRVLMPSPHLENGSHDIISLSATESQVHWKGLIAIRLVLRQPSPVWRTFHVEELNVYKDIPRRVPKPIQQIHTHLDPSRWQHYDSLLTLMHDQTLAALNWTPEVKTGSGCKDISGSYSYEFFSLPQV